MPFSTVLYNLLFEPLQILFEIIYGIAQLLVENKGLSIIILSLAMNMLVLPLYRRADIMQEEERDIQEKLKDGVEHIKRTFKGDERMMMLQTYYRQNNYKPTYALRGVTSLLLQIPFFIAAYRFLSTLEALEGTSFGIIPDLSKADGLITAFGISINIMPVIMTAINIVSSAIYSKGFPKKTKIQLYVTALFFLVFLYKSPSGLVFYWTLNNAFSLLKTLYYKSKNPKKALRIGLSIAGFALLLVGSINYNRLELESFLLIILLFVALQLPILVSRILGKKSSNKNKHIDFVPNKKIFFASSVFMALLTGAVIPSNVIKASPQEFVYTTCYVSPMWYIVSSLCLSVGTFVLWLGVFYWLSSNKARVVFEKAMTTISVVSVVDYMFFGRHLGQLTSDLTYGEGILFNTTEGLLNIAVTCAIVLLAVMLFKYIDKYLPTALVVCSIAFCILASVNIYGTNASLANVNADNGAENLSISLSKDKKNVVVIMLDRAVGAYVPYIMNEKPELKEKFDGFTYYSNTISFGKYTNFGSPALYGGYEYTPAAINNRRTFPLVTKQNEALRVMPVIFGENGFDVTVCNPTYAGYQWIPDLSIYDDYDYINAYNTGDTFLTNKEKLSNIKSRYRNFYMYSIMKVMPLVLQSSIYDNGGYFSNNTSFEFASPHESYGNNCSFLNDYYTLNKLSSITNSDASDSSFVMMSNKTTHEFQLLQEPDYTPSKHVDNTEYDENNTDRFSVDGITMDMSIDLHYSHYQTNVAALLRLGEWFDSLRELGVYDNTKIIIVSDHGAELYQFEELANGDFDAESYSALLMVKDFGATGFSTSKEFMTNADVPTIAFADIVKDPVNPFTENKITNDDKYAHKQYVIDSNKSIVDRNNGNQYKPGAWYSISDDMWNKNNWAKVADEAVLTSSDIN